MGCFGWEEYYNWGPGSQQEYEKLKKKNPSFRDEYELLSFDEDFDEDEGLYVNVRRITDKINYNRTRRLHLSAEVEPLRKVLTLHKTLAFREFCGIPRAR